MDEQPIVIPINNEQFDEAQSILKKYGKEVYDAADLDIPFEDAVRLELVF